METLLVGLLKLPLVGPVINALCAWQYRLVAAAMRRARRHEVRPREWSNRELAKVAGQFDGAVINVSGWRDEDQRGGHYRDYFSRASAYAVSNFKGTKGMEDQSGDAVFIDLEEDLPAELREASSVALATDWESALEGEVDRMLARGVPDVHGVLAQTFERILISRALAHTGGRRIEAAQALGIGRNTITRKIAELGIDGGKEHAAE